MLGLALRISQMALAAGIVILLWTAISPFARSQTPAFVTTAAATPSVETRPDGPRYQVIAQRNLFAPLKRAPEPEPAPKPIEPTKLDARLLGTLVGEEQEDRARVQGSAESLAIVRDIDGSVAVVGLRDDLAQGAARVVSIEKRRIVIEHQGRLEAIVLKEDAEPSRRSRRSRARRARSESSRPTTIRERTRAGLTPSGEMLSLMRNMRQLGRFAAERDADGALNGVRVTRITEGSPLTDLGVEVGDRIAAVNGIPLTGDEAGLGVMASLVGGDDPVLTVEDPRGRSREVVVPRDALAGLRRGR